MEMNAVTFKFQRSTTPHQCDDVHATAADSRQFPGIDEQHR